MLSAYPHATMTHSFDKEEYKAANMTESSRTADVVEEIDAKSNNTGAMK
jgi:hypothetical protein